MIDTNFFVKKAEFNLAQIAEICGAALQNADRGGEMIRDINTMDKAGEGEICFSMIAKKSCRRRNQGFGLRYHRRTGAVCGSGGSRSCLRQSENGLSDLKRSHVCGKTSGGGHCRNSKD